MELLYAWCLFIIAVQGLPTGETEQKYDDNCIVVTDEKQRQINNLVNRISAFINNISTDYDDIDLRVIEIGLDKHSNDEVEKDTRIQVTINDCSNKRVSTDLISSVDYDNANRTKKELRDEYKIEDKMKTRTLDHNNELTIGSSLNNGNFSEIVKNDDDNTGDKQEESDGVLLKFTSFGGSTNEEKVNNASYKLQIYDNASEDEDGLNNLISENFITKQEAIDILTEMSAVNGDKPFIFYQDLSNETNQFSFYFT